MGLLGLLLLVIHVRFADGQVGLNSGLQKKFAKVPPSNFIGSDLLQLLTKDEVLVELRSDVEQKTEILEEIRKIQEGMNEALAATQENKKVLFSNVFSAREKLISRLDEILDPIQLNRLVGIYIRRIGGMTLCNSMVADKLNLTDAQRQQISEIASKQTLGDYSKIRGDIKEQIALRRIETGRQMLSVLTSEQRRLFDEAGN